MGFRPYLAIKGFAALERSKLGSNSLIALPRRLKAAKNSPRLNLELESTFTALLRGSSLSSTISGSQATPSSGPLMPEKSLSLAIISSRSL